MFNFKRKTMKKLFLISFIYISILSANNSFAQSNSEWTNVMDNWCEKYFSTCFSGREYIKITVTETKDIDDQTIKVSGYVTYKNYAGIQDTQEYFAKVTAYNNSVEVKFNKKSKNWFGNDYWEDCTKSLSK